MIACIKFFAVVSEGYKDRGHRGGIIDVFEADYPTPLTSTTQLSVYCNHAGTAGSKR